MDGKAVLPQQQQNAHILKLQHGGFTGRQQRDGAPAVYPETGGQILYRQAGEGAEGGRERR